MENQVKLYRYVLPNVKGSGWAVVVIGSDGYFSTVSDYGNYAYRWSHHGTDDFRKFLLRVDADYVRLKLNPNEVLDSIRTEYKLKNAICEARRNKRLESWEAREAYSEAGSISNELELNDWFNNWARYIDDYYDLAVYMPEPQILGFVNNGLPRIKDLIRQELELESCPVQSK